MAWDFERFYNKPPQTFLMLKDIPLKLKTVDGVFSHKMYTEKSTII